MRRGTIVAGVGAAVLGVGGVGTAAAADLPITISFTQGTTKAGMLPAAATATPAAPATFTGTINTTSLRATFPNADVKLPDAVLNDVDFGTAFGKGQLTLKTTPLSFTGAPSTTLFSLDLSGTLAYAFVAKVGTATYTCNSEAPVPVRLTGTAIDAAGAYSASGSQTSLVVRAANVQDPMAVVFCATLNTRILPATGIASSFVGKLTIPGLIPAGAPPVATTPPVSTPPPATTPPTTGGGSGTVARPGRLALSVSKPKAVRRGSSTVSKVVVRNTGEGTARSVVVSLSTNKAKGVTPRATVRQYTTIGPGKRRTFSVRLKSTKKAAKSSTLTAIATGRTLGTDTGVLAVSRSTTLTLR